MDVYPPADLQLMEADLGTNTTVLVAQRDATAGVVEHMCREIGNTVPTGFACVARKGIPFVRLDVDRAKLWPRQ